MNAPSVLASCMSITSTPPLGELGAEQLFHSTDGSKHDDRGEWYYVDRVLQEEARTDQGCIIKLTLWVLQTCETPPIVYYRLHDWTPGWNLAYLKRRMEWEENTQYPSKKSRATPFVKDLGPLPWPPLQDTPDQFLFCEECLAFWAKRGTPYHTQWEQGMAVARGRGHMDNFVWKKRCTECAGELFHKEWEGAGDQRGTTEWTTGDKSESGDHWYYVGSEIVPLTSDQLGMVRVHLPKLNRGDRPEQVVHTLRLPFTIQRPHLYEKYRLEWQQRTHSAASSSSAPLLGCISVVTCSNERGDSDSNGSDPGAIGAPWVQPTFISGAVGLRLAREAAGLSQQVGGHDSPAPRSAQWRFAPGARTGPQPWSRSHHA